jgi:hypothetical protein
MRLSLRERRHALLLYDNKEPLTDNPAHDAALSMLLTPGGSGSQSAVQQPAIVGSKNVCKELVRSGIKSTVHVWFFAKEAVHCTSGIPQISDVYPSGCATFHWQWHQ